jgi:hypothetical protein
MRRIGIGTAILVSFLLTLPLIGILYLGKVAFGLPFVPEDLFGWFVRAGAGPFVALSDWFANLIAGGSQTSPQAAELASQILSITLFLIIGMLVGLFFYLLAGRKTFVLDWVDGVAIGALFGAPLIFISLNSGSSPVNPVIQAFWLAVLFIAWGVGLALVYRRFGKIEAETAETASSATVVPPSGEKDESDLETGTDATGAGENVSPEAVEGTIGRRQFLLRLGASTAAITAISGVAAVALDNPERAVARRQTLPVADPETVAFYNRTFRRFSIVQLQPDAAEGEVNVLALGAEYPDHQYVTVWIGEQSPIVVYENIETALSAYRAGDTESSVEVVWLDR